MTVRSLQSASSAERERLLADFVRLCEIESPSRSEAKVAAAVRAELEGLGLAVEEDDSAADTGADCGNLLGPHRGAARLADDPALRPPRHRPARRPGRGEAGERPAQQRPRRDPRRRQQSCRRHHPCGNAAPDERGRTGRRRAAVHDLRGAALAGAKAFDPGSLNAEYGFVFDHATPVGEIVTASPTYYRLEADFRGQAAHAGIRPERGHNAIVAAARAIAAMETGRLDEVTTANVGQIEGGTAPNVVAERCKVVLETRSLDDVRAGEVVSSMVDAIAGAASDLECDVETAVERQFRATSSPARPPVETAAEALRSLGIEASYINTGGGSDATP